METKQKIQQRRNGTVVQRSGAKTVSVLVKRDVRHPVYGKRYSVSKKYLAHDQKDEAQVGDMVTIELGRPISKHKRWRIVYGS